VGLREEEMTVSELIDELSKLPPDAEVIIYNDGRPQHQYFADLIVVLPSSNLEDLGYKPGDELVVVG
jgi:hypothetical protein